MKRLDMTDICVVYAGDDWRHELPPCSREMMTHLERNEKLVSWLQPVKGTVHDQLPAIRVKDEFYSISLRMMKAIWRHVRLRKGFDNVERAPYGGLKLKIPVTLLAEKLRTQSRFNVSTLFLRPTCHGTHHTTACHGIHIIAVRICMVAKGVQICILFIVWTA
jgi:hypothetical protein